MKIILITKIIFMVLSLSDHPVTRTQEVLNEVPLSCDRVYIGLV